MVRRTSLGRHPAPLRSAIPNDAGLIVAAPTRRPGKLSTPSITPPPRVKEGARKTTRPLGR